MKKNQNGETKKVKVKYKEDDGHTIYNMDGVPQRFGGKKPPDGEKLTFKEKFAIFRAALLKVLPAILTTVLCFSLVALLLYFWLMN